MLKPMPNSTRNLVLTFALGVLAVMALMRPPSLLAQNKATHEGPPPMNIKVGDKVPDFTLKDQNGKDIALHDYLGKGNVVLAFYVFAFTGG
jgi:cytochrome oxidase Cu insertion factor (SCO1/SenC/PrrC family)